MAQVDNPTALLVMALQDLYDGEQAMAQRLPVVRDHVRTPALRSWIKEYAVRSHRQRDRLADIARSLDAEPQGDSNIWLRAILDDADNDASSIAAGPLRDTALVGALRKAKQAERVSYETAMVLARRLSLHDALQRLTLVRDEEQTADDALAAMLEQMDLIEETA